MAYTDNDEMTKATGMKRVVRKAIKDRRQDREESSSSFIINSACIAYTGETTKALREKGAGKLADGINKFHRAVGLLKGIEESRKLSKMISEYNIAKPKNLTFEEVMRAASHDALNMSLEINTVKNILHSFRESKRLLNEYLNEGAEFHIETAKTLVKTSSDYIAMFSKPTAETTEQKTIEN